jgi:hypothetical protein
MTRRLDSVAFVAFVLVTLVALSGLPASTCGTAEAQQVTLPLAQFEELRSRASSAGQAALPPPAPFAVESDEIAITAGPLSARVVQTLTLTLFAGDWQAIPLYEAGSFIRADLGGLEGRIDAAAGGLAVRGAGRHRVQLESVVPVQLDAAATRPTWRFNLRPPAAALVRGRLDLAVALSPRVEEATLGASGLLHVSSAGTDASTGAGVRPAAAAWAFDALPARELEFRLLGKALLPERRKLQLAFEATSASAATLSHTELRVHARVQVKVAQGELRELRLALPDGLTVVGVTGPIAGWNLEPGRARLLAVTPLEPVDSTLAVELELTGPPRDDLAAPLLLPLGASHVTLLARAGLRGDGLLILVDLGASRVADPADEAALASTLHPGEGGETGDGKVYAILDPSRPPRWRAVWAERTEVLAAEVDELWVVVAVGEAGSASYQLWAKVRNRGAGQLTVTLPAGFELARCSRDGFPLPPGLARPGGGLAVPLLTREPAQLVHLAGILPLSLPPARGELTVPLPLLSAPVARVQLRVLLPGGRRYELDDATRSGRATSPPVSASAAPDQPAAGSGIAAVLARPSAALAVEEDPPLALPAGHYQIAATWTALTAEPAPLVIRVRRAREKNPWF